MKTSFLLAAACSLAALATAHADLTIVQKTEGAIPGGQAMESTTKIKDTRLRVDTGMATVLMDSKTGDMTQVMPAAKTYMKIPAAAVQQMLDMAKQMQEKQGTAGAKMQITPTGKKDTINGFASEEYTLTYGGTKSSCWLTRAIPDYAGALKQMNNAFSQGPMASMMKGAGLDLGALPGFPVRMNQTVNGQTITTNTISVSAAPIPDGDFALPADYKEMDMSQMMAPPSHAPAAPASSSGKARPTPLPH